MKHLPWRRLTRDQQLTVATYAHQHGLTSSATHHNVSKTAVRRACAIHGLLPKPYERAISKRARIATALSLLRSLRLTPKDLM